MNYPNYPNYPNPEGNRLICSVAFCVCRPDVFTANNYTKHLHSIKPPEPRATPKADEVTMLNDEEWQNWSSRKIAEACKVNSVTVDNIRRELAGADNHTADFSSIKSETRTFIHPKTGKPTQMNISNMRKPEPRPEPQPEIYHLSILGIDKIIHCQMT